MKSHLTGVLFLTIDSQVLHNIVQNKSDRGSHDPAKNNRHQHENDDFNPDVSLDDLVKDSSNKSPRRGNVQSVQLAAKMVSCLYCRQRSEKSR